MIHRLLVIVAVLAGSFVAFSGSAHAAAPGPLPTSARAANGYIVCLYDGAPLHLGLCISMPV